MFMEYTTLGSPGIEISRICLGCMSFGSSDWRDWVLDETESREIIYRAVDLGINFFDTANVYSMGESERVVGNALGATTASVGHCHQNASSVNSAILSLG